MVNNEFCCVSEFDVIKIDHRPLGRLSKNEYSVGILSVQPKKSTCFINSTPEVCYL